METLNQVVITKSVNGVEVGTLTELGILLGVKPSTILGWADKYKNFPSLLPKSKVLVVMGVLACSRLTLFRRGTRNTPRHARLTNGQVSCPS